MMTKMGTSQFSILNSLSALAYSSSIYMWDETVWCNDRHTTGWMVTPDEASNSQAAHGPGGHHLFFCGEEQPILETKPDTEKTRCSPRTRNKLFEQSCTFSPCYCTSAL